MAIDLECRAAKELSIVIPTYNRRDLVIHAVRSALDLSDSSDIEVIVIDDNSSDDTVPLLRREFGKQLEEGLIRLASNAENMGATGAKNIGAALATGEWIIFLDSDDLLRKESFEALVGELRAARGRPMVFFRCIDIETGELIGRQEPLGFLIGLKIMLSSWKWGECLPVVNREAFMRFPYDASLRGFENLSYCRMTRTFGPACLSTVVARAYRTVGDDRLSSRVGLRIRSCELARGHWRMAWEFAHAAGFASTAVRVVKACVYATRCLTLRVAPKRSRNFAGCGNGDHSTDE
jgi:glycosyltransferase involved in cell wall biosynthesis